MFPQKKRTIGNVNCSDRDDNLRFSKNYLMSLLFRITMRFRNSCFESTKFTNCTQQSIILFRELYRSLNHIFRTALCICALRSQRNSEMNNIEWLEIM